MPGQGANYVCPQCGPDPRGGNVHAQEMHTMPSWGGEVEAELAMKVAEQHEEIDKLKAEIKKLKAQSDRWEDSFVDSENERIDAVEALAEIDQMLIETVELTYRDGPLAGMERVARWLEEYSDFYHLSLRPKLPYDWLRRWLITDRVNA